MEVKPEVYSKINGAHQRDAQKIIKKIEQDGLEEENICVDIGCGSGNVTQLIADAIPSARIYAFDIDAAMIEFAAKSIMTSMSTDQDDAKKIFFFKDDISNCWEDLSEHLRSLEGKVDIIWSNIVHHWVLQKYQQRAISNIFRLLKSGGKGRVYLSLCLYRPIDDVPFPVLAGNKRIQDLLFVPDLNVQAAVWLKYFEPFELTAFDHSVETIKWSHKLSITGKAAKEKWSYTLAGYAKIIKQFVDNGYETYFLSNLTEEEKHIVSTQCFPTICNALVWTTETEGTDEAVINVRGDMLDVRAIKK